MILNTERLILRPWTEADAEDCCKYAKDPDVGPRAGWPVHTSAAESARIIREVLMKPDIFAVVLKETGEVVGSVGLKKNSDLACGDDERELGYWLGKPLWGRGLMPEAVREVLRYAFEDLKLNRVWCGHYDGNEQSKRVQEKCGFVFVRTVERVEVPLLGEIRKGHVRCLEREDWLRRKDRAASGAKYGGK
ncbi:MAG: GNAT family N-acetyltransferase [Clostridia bacterium]|nr:GNAT family N-acetyltransferase [Clostridia bacterium]